LIDRESGIDFDFDFEMNEKIVEGKLKPPSRLILVCSSPSPSPSMSMLRLLRLMPVVAVEAAPHSLRKLRWNWRGYDAILIRGH